MTDVPTPLLAADSPLDESGRTIVERVHRAELAKVATLPTDDPRDPKRRQRVEWTREELMAQPAAIAQTLAAERDAIRDTAQRLSANHLSRAYLVGCGDSLAVMVGLRLLLERLLGIPCEPIQALDFAYYQSELAGPESLVIALSSSGETTRTVEGLLVAAARGAPTLALTNTAGSTLAEQSDAQLLIHATRRGWPTQASTAAMALIGQLAVEMARARGETRAADYWQGAIHRLPDQLEQVITRQDEAVARIAHEERHRQLFLYAGGGPAFACAMFGAAKVKECSPAHGLAIPLEEYHHYNSQKPEDPLWLIVPAGRSVPRAIDTARAGREVGGRVYVVTTEGTDSFNDIGTVVVHLPSVEEPLASVVYTVPVQMFAYHVAMEKFRLADSS